ncbi:TonB-dependent receptor domain-containing protein [Sphingopyxis sp. 550A]
MTYVRASTGYKAGGFNARAADNNGFDPEDLTSYEIGFKSELFDRRLRFNVAACRTARTLHGGAQPGRGTEFHRRSLRRSAQRSDRRGHARARSCGG